MKLVLTGGPGGSEESFAQDHPRQRTTVAKMIKCKKVVGFMAFQKQFTKVLNRPLGMASSCMTGVNLITRSNR
jgi:hypothetical protein